MKISKRLISVLLCGVMLIGSAPLSGFIGLEIPEWLDFSTKAEASGVSVPEFGNKFVVSVAHLTTVPDGYTAIYTATDFYNIRNNKSGKYILMNSIDMSSYNWSGFGANRLTLDGNGYIVYNFHSTSSGLFSSGFATVKNIGFENMDIKTNSDKIAGIIGSSSGSGSANQFITIDNCYLSGNIQGKSYVGGFLGFLDWIDGSSITNCANYANITGSSYVGGMIGRISTLQGETYSITKCINTGKIVGTSYVGSMLGVGVAYGDQVKISMTQCCNYGEIYSASGSNIGGICGMQGNQHGTVSVQDCYNVGTVKGNSGVGGITGASGGTIKNSYNVGLVIGNSDFGSIVGNPKVSFSGLLYDGTHTCSATNCYYLIGISSPKGTTLTESQMKSQVNYSGFSFSSVWGINPKQNSGFPFLRCFSNISYAWNFKEKYDIILPVLGEHSLSVKTFVDSSNGSNILSDVTVRLYDSNGNIIANQTTDSTGSTTFTHDRTGKALTFTKDILNSYSLAAYKTYGDIELCTSGSIDNRRSLNYYIENGVMLDDVRLYVDLTVAYQDDDIDVYNEIWSIMEKARSLFKDITEGHVIINPIPETSYHHIGNKNKISKSNCDILIFDEVPVSSAHPGGYFNGGHIFTAKSKSKSENGEDQIVGDMDAETICHELGHYILGYGDEYCSAAGIVREGDGYYEKDLDGNGILDDIYIIYKLEKGRNIKVISGSTELNTSRLDDYFWIKNAIDPNYTYYKIFKDDFYNDINTAIEYNQAGYIVSIVDEKNCGCYWRHFWNGDAYAIEPSESLQSNIGLMDNQHIGIALSDDSKYAYIINDNINTNNPNLITMQYYDNKMSCHEQLLDELDDLLESASGYRVLTDSCSETHISLSLGSNNQKMSSAVITPSASINDFFINATETDFNLIDLQFSVSNNKLNIKYDDNQSFYLYVSDMDTFEIEEINKTETEASLDIDYSKEYVLYAVKTDDDGLNKYNTYTIQFPQALDFENGVWSSVDNSYQVKTNDINKIPDQLVLITADINKNSSTDNLINDVYYVVCENKLEEHSNFTITKEYAFSNKYNIQSAVVNYSDGNDWQNIDVRVSSGENPDAYVSFDCNQTGCYILNATAPSESLSDFIISDLTVDTESKECGTTVNVNFSSSCNLFETALYTVFYSSNEINEDNLSTCDSVSISSTTCTLNIDELEGTIYVAVKGTTSTGQTSELSNSCSCTFKPIDSDNDGIPDYWIANYPSLSKLEDIPGTDTDEDGLTNLQEYNSGTNPLNPDSDGDNVYDSVELWNGLDPLKTKTDGRTDDYTVIYGRSDVYVDATSFRVDGENAIFAITNNTDGKAMRTRIRLYSPDGELLELNEVNLDAKSTVEYTFSSEYFVDGMKIMLDEEHITRDTNYSNNEFVYSEASSISAVSSNCSVVKADTAQLEYVLEPNGSNDIVSWSSDNTDIATVDKRGLVKGVSIGTVTITATTTNGLTCEYSILVEPFEGAGLTDYECRLISSSTAVEITGYIGSENSIIIPNEIGGLPVTSVADNSFSTLEIQSISIGEKISNIGKAAFNGINNLTLINVDNSNQNFSSIDGVLFNNSKTTLLRYPSAKAGENYVIPSMVTTISENAFCDSNNLSTITIPESVNSIGKSAVNSSTLTGIEYLGSERTWNMISVNSASGIAAGIIHFAKYTLTLYNEENVFYFHDYTPGDTLNITGIPNKKYYTFVGWTPEIPDIMPDYNFDAYAVWRVSDNTHYVKYMVEDELFWSDMRYEGEEITKPDEIPEKTGYTFNGWTPSGYDVMPDDNLTFNAEWTVNNFCIKWYVDNEVYAETYVNYGDEIVPPDDPSTGIDGYYFQSWTGIPNSMPNSTLSIYATMVFDCVYVGETIVTDSNADDVFGDGSVSYDSDNKILKLNNATISDAYSMPDVPGYDEGVLYGIFSTHELTILAEGANLISVSDSDSKTVGVYSDNLTFTGTGKLTINVDNENQGECFGIEVSEITVDGPEISVVAGNEGYGHAVEFSDCKHYTFNLYSGSIETYGGILSYNDNCLDLNIDCPDKTDYETYIGNEKGGTGRIHCNNLYSTNSKYMKFEVEKISFNTVLYVGGVRVNDDNADDVFNDGTVSYNIEENVLYLKNASIDGLIGDYNIFMTDDFIGNYSLCNGYGIYSDGYININLSGKNSINVSSSFECERLLGAYSDEHIEFSGNGELDISAEDDNCNEIIGVKSYELIINGPKIVSKIKTDNDKIGMGIFVWDINPITIYDGSLICYGENGAIRNSYNPDERLMIENDGSLRAEYGENYDGSDTVITKNTDELIDCKYIKIYALPVLSTVSFVVDGNIYDLSKIYEPGESASTPTAPEKNGYYFMGWNTLLDGTGLSYSDEITYSGEKNITYYAQWMPFVYEISYDSNGGSSVNSQPKIHDIDTCITNEVPKKIVEVTFDFQDGTGHIYETSVEQSLSCWNDQDGQQYKSGDVYSKNKDAVLKAVWDDVFVTVIKQDKRTGYSFLGWNTKPDGTGETYYSGNSIKVTENLVLYAQWKINTYKITYDGNSGITPPEQNVNYGQDYVICDAKHDKVTIIFDANGGICSTKEITLDVRLKCWKDNNNVEYMPGDIYKVNSNLKLKACWEADDVVIPTPTRKGYTFRYWTNMDSTVYPGNVYNTIENVTFRAYWTEGDNRVSYNLNGGVDGPESQLKYDNVRLRLSTVVPTKASTVRYHLNDGTEDIVEKSFQYVFECWEDSEGNQYLPGDYYDKNEDLILEAKWGYPDNNHDYIVLNPTKIGYKLRFWAKQNMNGKRYYIGDFVGTDADADYYASWEEMKYSVSYDSNGGSGSPYSQIKYYFTPLTLSSVVPKIAGAHFVCWNTKADGTGTDYYPGDMFYENSNTVLYAKYLSYKVTFVVDGEVIMVQDYSQTDKQIEEPAVPIQPYRMNGRWSQYDLSKGGDIIVYAIYEMPETVTIPQWTMLEDESHRLLVSSNYKVNSKEWYTSDNTVAIVDDTGNVSAVGKGTCNIIVKCYGEDDLGNPVITTFTTKVIVLSNQYDSFDNGEKGNSIKSKFEFFFIHRLRDIIEEIKFIFRRLAPFIPA